MKHVVIGTAGHIDHGKSALVMALTGTDPDRLEEEKRRGITIDLGFAHMDLGQDLRAAFIDVPGHERFVRNMLAGITGIDAVVLVIAADESIKPQTREHFDICRLLGVRRGVVALTKADLVERDILDLVRLEIQEFVAGSFLDTAPVIAVSARTGEGLADLKSELQRLGLAAASRPLEPAFRLPIDRAFTMKGFGSVVTGTLAAGKVHKEAEVEIFPLGRRVRVRGIQVHGRPEDVALAGQRAALNLSGIEVQEVGRGMVLAPPGQFQASARLDCSLRLLPSTRRLKNRARVHFHCWTSETLAEVVLLDGKELKPGEAAYVQLRLQESGLYLPGDRFIVRQFSPVVTIGGGVVLDNLPEKHRTGDSAPRHLLEALEASEPEARLELLLQSAGEASISQIVARTGWQAGELLVIAAKLQEKNKVLILGQPATQLAHRHALESVSLTIHQIIANFHDCNPLSPGISKEELRVQPGLRIRGCSLPSQLLFDAALGGLLKAGQIQMREQMVALAGRGVTLNSEEAAAKQEISRAFESAGLRVPPASEVLSSLQIERTRASKILQILVKEKTLYRVAEGLIFHHSALERLRGLLAERKKQADHISVPQFKELTGITRKYAIPLLEYLDRERVTRRAGDERIIL